MRADSLEKKLQERPKPEELIKEGIMDGKLLWESGLEEVNGGVRMYGW